MEDASGSRAPRRKEAVSSSRFRARTSPSEGRGSQTSHLLIVEDSSQVTDALRILFEENGYRVSVAASVAEAVQIGVHDRPDVALLDFVLGGENGLEVLARWRECGVALPPVAALTGHDDSIVRQRCLDAGCAQVLIKPVPTKDLLAKTNALVGR